MLLVPAAEPLQLKSTPTGEAWLMPERSGCQMSKKQTKNIKCSDSRTRFIESIKDLTPDEIEKVKTYALTLKARRTLSTCHTPHQKSQQ